MRTASIWSTLNKTRKGRPVAEAALPSVGAHCPEAFNLARKAGVRSATERLTFKSNCAVKSAAATRCSGGKQTQTMQRNRSNKMDCAFAKSRCSSLVSPPVLKHREGSLQQVKGQWNLDLKSGLHQEILGHLENHARKLLGKLPDFGVCLGPRLKRLQSADYQQTLGKGQHPSLAQELLLPLLCTRRDPTRTWSSSSATKSSNSSGCSLMTSERWKQPKHSKTTLVLSKSKLTQYLFNNTHAV